MEITASTSLTYGRGYVYNLRYHLVWCVKYRKPVLTGDIEGFLKTDLSETASALGMEIIVMETMPDHVHLLVNCSPQHFIPSVVKILKGNSARHLFMRFPQLKKSLWGGHLWNPSYFVATISDNTVEQVEEYIRNQKMK